MSKKSYFDIILLPKTTAIVNYLLKMTYEICVKMNDIYQKLFDKCHQV